MDFMQRYLSTNNVLLHHPVYPYDRSSAFRYVFTSVGRRQIKKIVAFKPTPLENVFNIGFGDLLADGVVDDKAVSNNGDTSKVLVTVIQIIREFTTEFPHIKVMFR